LFKEEDAMQTPAKGSDSDKRQAPVALVKPLRTLAVDIGATGIKLVVLNELGEPITDRARMKTPDSGKPVIVINTVIELAEQQGEFDRVSVGFPGVVRHGVVKQAPKLSSDWKDINLANALFTRLKKPVRVANDADVQGFGAISGSGVELVVTLGTGVGSALFVDGALVSNVEVGHGKLSDAQLKSVGKKRWNNRLVKAIRNWTLSFIMTGSMWGEATPGWWTSVHSLRM
jgi:polyphosphate glucokinase